MIGLGEIVPAGPQAEANKPNRALGGMGMQTLLKCRKSQTG